MSSNALAPPVADNGATAALQHWPAATVMDGPDVALDRDPVRSLPLPAAEPDDVDPEQAAIVPTAARQTATKERSERRTDGVILAAVMGSDWTGAPLLGLPNGHAMARMPPAP